MQGATYVNKLTKSNAHKNYVEVVILCLFWLIFRDDQIILSGIISYLVNTTMPGGSHLPIWRTDGVILAILLHAGPVVFPYYWLHRALHHHYLYSHYHSHHHSSIITKPITCKTYYYMFLLHLPFHKLSLVTNW